MKKKSVLLVSFVTILILGIGGKIYMNEKKNNDVLQKQQLLNAEKDIALNIVQNYEGVTTINFADASYNKQTGSWSVDAEINNNQNLWLSFGFTISKNKTIIGSSSYYPETFTLKKEVDTSKSIEKIIVNYGGIK